MNIRKNINTLTTPETLVLKSAFRQGYAAAPGYEEFAGIHGLPAPVSCPHHSADFAFLPWHREYVLQFEQLLQRFEPSLALPYWDWTEDPSATSDGLPPLTQAELIGGVNQNPLASATMRWVPGFIEQFGNQLTPAQLEFLGEGREPARCGYPRPRVTIPSDTIYARLQPPRSRLPVSPN